MTPFRFKLQKVLELREEKEKQSAVGLARARQDADLAREAREDLQAAREAGRARLTQAHGAGGPVGHLHNLALVVGTVDQHIRAAEDECRKADERVVDSMKEFHQAFQERRTIDQLRTRRLEQWRSEQTKSEQKSMDEMAMTRYSRQDQSVTGGE